MQNFLLQRIKKTLKERLEILKKVIFFTNAGTLHQRALRIKNLISLYQNKLILILGSLKNI